jgi:hypothetical protein
MPNRVTHNTPALPLAGHMDCSGCSDPLHATYVTNVRARLALFGPDNLPDVLPCGCMFMVMLCNERIR